MAGADIDLDNFSSTSNSTSEIRSQTIACDPHASSEFFHFIIKAVLEELFGLYGHDTHRKKKVRKEGIFGRVASYIGTVEAQGRGSLHLHIVLWLCEAPIADMMKELLKKESFRHRVANFIDKTIKGDVDGVDSQEMMKTSRPKAVSFSWPLDPRNAYYIHLKQETEKRLVRAVQIHECAKGSCLVMKNNRLRCKQRAPFQKSAQAWMDENGNWGPKRLHAYINNWNPPILHSVRSNHDIKLISNGAETKNLTFYITNYVAKKQRNSSNVSALLAKRVAFHRKQEKYTVDVNQLNKQLLQRCANTLSREQEFSAPEVASYLSKHGDRYISDLSVPIFLDSFRWALKNTFLCLRWKRYVNKNFIYVFFFAHKYEVLVLSAISMTLGVKSLQKVKMNCRQEIYYSF
jgi:hypothetical protein